MKAVRLHRYGGPDVLAAESVAKPEPRDDEVLIRVQAAGVNPVDCKTRAGAFQTNGDTLPLTMGRDVAGEIEAVGPGVETLSVGQPVYAFLASRSGGYAEYALARTHEVAPKPHSLEPVRAAAVPLAALTAWQALFEHGRLEPGQRVLIHGAAGGVGHFAVQLARDRGATVIAVGAAQDRRLLESLRIDQFVDRAGPPFENVVEPVDLVVDLIGGEVQSRSWQVLKNRGSIVSLIAEPSAEDAAAHGARATAFMTRASRSQLEEIARLIDSGRITVEINRTFELEEAAAAHEHIERHHSQGKVVLTTIS